MLGVASGGSEAEEAAESPCGLARSVGDDDPGLQGDGGVVGDTEGVRHQGGAQAAVLPGLIHA